MLDMPLDIPLELNLPAAVSAPACGSCHDELRLSQVLMMLRSP